MGPRQAARISATDVNQPHWPLTICEYLLRKRQRLPEAPAGIAELGMRMDDIAPHLEFDGIQAIDPERLRPWARNARTHNKKQLRQIADSIRIFGFTNPVLIDEAGNILAGHGRVAAAKMLGLATVPCRLISHMTEAQKRAYVIADNKLAMNAGWDDEILAIELSELSQVLVDVDWDVGITGFSIPEIDGLIEGLAPQEPDDPEDDRLPRGNEGWAVSRPGDLWHLGEHRLICGDALVDETYARLLGAEMAQMIFTDPPYNVRIDGHVSGGGRVRHREFWMASGEMSRAEFSDFLRAALSQLACHSVDGSIHFVCMDWRHLGEILAAGEQAYTELKNLIVWVKDNGGMGTFYRSRHELILAFKNGTAPHINSFELGQHGRYRTNVWQYRGVNTLKPGRMEELGLHPTVKPVAMIADAIKDCSQRAGIILDPFGGSGSTLIAAAKTGRRARLAEIDPIYVDRIIRRWQVWAKDEAVHGNTGQSFAATAAVRRADAGDPEVGRDAGG
jgi:DNA modification methylase